MEIGAFEAENNPDALLDRVGHGEPVARLVSHAGRVERVQAEAAPSAYVRGRKTFSSAPSIGVP